MTIRRALGWALVGGLSIAALAASAALVSGDLDEADARVIGMSIGFALFSAVGASGAGLRVKASGPLRELGTVTAILAAASFVVLLFALWGSFEPPIDEDLWRFFGCIGVASLAASHACLVLGARKQTDSSLVIALAMTSVVLGVADTIGVMVPILGTHLRGDEAELLGVLTILLLLTTFLPPILRRLEPVGERSEGATVTVALADVGSEGSDTMDELLAIADRIEAMSVEGHHAADVRQECRRLRKTALSLRA